MIEAYAGQLHSADDFITSAYREDPQKSRKRILRHLQLLLPAATEKQLEKIIKG